ncbi:hypothetical protein TNCV_4514841 [Trichonephila clavipes]|nr:hypothetical protein TNCV_4514841 [Trichonephila clavipes]
MNMVDSKFQNIPRDGDVECMSRLFKPHRVQDNFCLYVASITILPLVLTTPLVVDLEAGDWSRNCTGHLSVSWIRKG